MQPLEINSLLSSADAVDNIAKCVREFFLADNSGRTHADRVCYSAAPHDPNGFVVHVLHAKITARFEYARYTMPDFRLISGQYVFTRKIGDKDTLLPIRLRMVAPYHLLLPGGQVCNLNSPGSIGPYANMLWDAMAYALLGEVLQEAEEWSQKP